MRIGRSLLIALAFAAVAAAGTAAQVIDADAGACSQCDQCVLKPDWIYFIDVVSGPNSSYWEGWLSGWGCIDYTCNDPHIECGDYGDSDAEDVTLLGELFPGAESEALAEFIRSHPGRLQNVPERRAIQLVGCRGTVVEHLPLSLVRTELLAFATRPT